MILPSNKNSRTSDAATAAFVKKLASGEYTKDMQEKKIEAFGSPKQLI